MPAGPEQGGIFRALGTRPESRAGELPEQLRGIFGGDPALAYVMFRVHERDAGVTIPARACGAAGAAAAQLRRPRKPAGTLDPVPDRLARVCSMWHQGGVAVLRRARYPAVRQSPAWPAGAPAVRLDAVTRQPADGGFGRRFYLVGYLPTYAAALFCWCWCGPVPGAGTGG